MAGDDIGLQSSCFNLKSTQMCWLALFALFEYISYGSTAIINIFTPSVRGRQNLTS